MPYRAVESTLFHEFCGIKIYHTYKNDMEDDVSEFWYSIDSFGSAYDLDVIFDIRTIAVDLLKNNFKSVAFKGRKNIYKNHKVIIENAIKHGLLKSYSGRLITPQPEELRKWKRSILFRRFSLDDRPEPRRPETKWFACPKCGNEEFFRRMQIKEHSYFPVFVYDDGSYASGDDELRDIYDYKEIPIDDEIRCSQCESVYDTTKLGGEN